MFFDSERVRKSGVYGVVGGGVGGFLGKLYADYKEYSDKQKVCSILIGVSVGGLCGGLLGYFVAPAIISATGVAGVSITAKGISTIAAIGTIFGKTGTLIANNGEQLIDWGKITLHAVQRMAERGVTADMIETWVKTGKALRQAGDKILYVTRQGVVVIDKAGRIITAYTSKEFDPIMKEIVKKLFGE